MKPDSLLRKYKKKASKKYLPSSFEKLERVLRKLSDGNERVSSGEILRLIRSLLLLEKEGSIRGVEIKFLQDLVSITWDDASLGSPILIKIADKETMASLREGYKSIKGAIPEK